MAIKQRVRVRSALQKDLPYEIVRTNLDGVFATAPPPAEFNLHNIESGASACLAKETSEFPDAVRLGFELPERYPTTGLAASGSSYALARMHVRSSSFDR